MSIQDHRPNEIRNEIFRKSLARLSSPLEKKPFRKGSVRYNFRDRPWGVKSQQDLRRFSRESSSSRSSGGFGKNKERLESLLNVKKVQARPFSIESYFRQARSTTRNFGAMTSQTKAWTTIPQKVFQNQGYLPRNAQSPRYSKAGFISRFGNVKNAFTVQNKSPRSRQKENFGDGLRKKKKMYKQILSKRTDKVCRTSRKYIKSVQKRKPPKQIKLKQTTKPLNRQVLTTNL
ncbi:unnamed protein product [Moneuplotes crassus]|uniref:Uncharacterized protein n=1 Tax=Euplotes crassus TaxID=5936 RepID=A0AAD1X971_EUPCR|nr:unnamed protein product [Moneuplotes crassus]